jgi:crotonobetainyl-CoA:carnitine CoA-transferase CaiB-like acyl-CoA transferase
MTAAPDRSSQPLAGLKVLDATSVIAGPLASMLLADFGADVVKIEHPAGDPIRQHGESKDGIPLWWLMLARNKKCVSLYLGHPEGQAVFRRLAAEADVVIENFRVGTMARWGLDYATLAADNPGLVMAHVTGFGQIGPRRADPGFGTLAEAMSGFAHRTGEPDGPPTLPPFGLADGMTGISTAYAVMVALYERARTGLGQELDLAIAEPLLTVLEPQLTTYDQLGLELTRAGSRAQTNAPRGIYQTADDRWIAVSASTIETATRFITLLGRPDVAKLPWMASAETRTAHADELDAIIVPWFRSRLAEDALNLCREAAAPAALVYAPSDILADEQFNATGAIATVEHEQLGSVRMPGLLFRMSGRGGEIHWPGRSTGADNDEVYEALGLDAEEQERLREMGVI